MKDKKKLSVNNREGTLIIEAIFSNLAYDLLLACGMTFVIILGGVDLSVGAVLALSGIICTLMIQKGINIVLAVGLGILFGGAIGAVNGILVSKANVAPFVATLGSQSICRGACYVLTSGYFVAGLTDAYTNIGRGSLLGVPNKILVSITIMLLLALLSRRFRPLRSMFYVGGNRQAAFISGIPSGLTIILGYMISGLMAGIAAILMTSSLGMGHAGYGISFEMKAISAAVIGGADMHGGAGSFLGTALGVILVALVNNVFIMFNGSPNWSSAISGLMLLAAVAFDALRRRRKPR